MTKLCPSFVFVQSSAGSHLWHKPFYLKIDGAGWTWLMFDFYIRRVSQEASLALVSFFGSLQKWGTRPKPTGGNAKIIKHQAKTWLCLPQLYIYIIIQYMYYMYVYICFHQSVSLLTWSKLFRPRQVSNGHPENRRFGNSGATDGATVPLTAW